MKIGVIGPDLSCKKIKTDLDNIDSSLYVSLYPRELAGDAIDVIDLCEAECDAVIFSGCGVSNSVLSRHTMKKPHEFVSKGGTSIALAFLEMQSKGFSVNNFSIDVVESQVLDDFLYELNINPTNIFTYPYKTFDEQLYIDWHLKLIKEKKINIVLTGFVNVYHTLEKMGINVFYISVTRSLVRVCYDKIISKLALSEAKYSQISVEIIHLENRPESSYNYYSNKIKNCETESFIIDYARSIQGSIFNVGRNEYVIFTSRGCAENDHNYKDLYNLQKKVSESSFRLSFGIGTGLTAYEAETNARKALNYSLKGKDNNNIFFIDENNDIKGPLLSDDYKNYSIISNDKKVIEISKKTDLSCQSVLRLLSIIETRKCNVFDAAQLADCLDVSVRSARRIMNKLLSAELGRVYAKESSAAGGRPKSLVEILI